MTPREDKRWNWNWLRRKRVPAPVPVVQPARIGIALGGGFARGIAHVGVLRVLEREKIPVHCITGVSAGSIVAAAYASGASLDEIAAAAASMRFGHVARWGLSKLGLAGSERMTPFLQRLLKQMKFEEMQIPLGVIATDIRNGEAVEFRDHGDVAPAIRASCSYPGLFRPVQFEGRTLVDGGVSVEVPSYLARKMGATHVIGVCIPSQDENFEARHMLDVINRCFQIMMAHNEESWRAHSDLVLLPDVGAIPWDGFHNAERMIAAGESAAERALPQIREWHAGVKEAGSSPQFVPVHSPPARLSVRV